MKTKFRACIARGVKDKLSFDGREALSRKEKLELTHSQVVKMLPAMRNIPVKLFHNRHAVVGAVVSSYLDHNMDWWVEMEFSNRDDTERNMTRLIRSGALPEVSLGHNAQTLNPFEVSLVFEGARPGTTIDPNPLDKSNKPYTLQTREYQSQASDSSSDTVSTDEQKGNDSWVLASFGKSDLLEVTSMDEFDNDDFGSAGLGMPDLKKKNNNNGNNKPQSDTRRGQQQQPPQQPQQPKRSSLNDDLRKSRDVDTKIAHFKKIALDAQKELAELEAIEEAEGAKPAGNKRMRLADAHQDNQHEDDDQMQDEDDGSSNNRPKPIPRRSDIDTEQRDKLARKGAAAAAADASTTGEDDTEMDEGGVSGLTPEKVSDAMRQVMKSNLNQAQKNTMHGAVLGLAKNQEKLQARLREAIEKNKMLTNRTQKAEDERRKLKHIEAKHKAQMAKSQKAMMAVFGEVFGKQGMSAKQIDRFQKKVKSGAMDPFLDEFGDHIVQAGLTAHKWIDGEQRFVTEEELKDETEAEDRARMVQDILRSNHRTATSLGASLDNDIDDDNGAGDDTEEPQTNKNRNNNKNNGKNRKSEKSTRGRVSFDNDADEDAEMEDSESNNNSKKNRNGRPNKNVRTRGVNYSDNEAEEENENDYNEDEDEDEIDDRNNNNGNRSNNRGRQKDRSGKEEKRNASSSSSSRRPSSLPQSQSRKQPQRQQPQQPKRTSGASSHNKEADISFNDVLASARHGDAGDVPDELIDLCAAMANEASNVVHFPKNGVPDLNAKSYHEEVPNSIEGSRMFVGYDSRKRRY